MKSHPFSLIRADWPDPMSLDAHQRRLSALWHEVYEYFQTSLPHHICALYVHDIQHLGFHEAHTAFSLYRTSPPPQNQVKRAPRPADILALVVPKLSTADAANEMASRIWGAIGSLGYAKPSSVVRAAIGEQGWEVVRQMGGNWRGLCQSVMLVDQTTWMAQLRDKSHAVLNKWDQTGAKLRIEAARERDQINEAKQKGDYLKLTSVQDVLRHMPQIHEGADRGI